MTTKEFHAHGEYVGHTAAIDTPPAEKGKGNWIETIKQAWQAKLNKSQAKAALRPPEGKAESQAAVLSSLSVLSADLAMLKNEAWCHGSIVPDSFAPDVRENLSPMKPAIKEQWVQALRSGEYPQTRTVLHDDIGFCALGVLADLYCKEFGTKWDAIPFKQLFPDALPSPQHNGCVYTYRGYGTTLPPEISGWAGLSWTWQRWVDRANDLGGYPFYTIASMIDKTL